MFQMYKYHPHYRRLFDAIIVQRRSMASRLFLPKFYELSVPMMKTPARRRRHAGTITDVMPWEDPCSLLMPRPEHVITANLLVVSMQRHYVYIPLPNLLFEISLVKWVLVINACGYLLLDMKQYQAVSE